jgi:hypothetical protein
MMFSTIILASLAVLGAVSAGPTAQSRRHYSEATLEVITLATGLDNPRGLAFAPNGALYVTEAGLGGGGPCFPQRDNLEGEEVCWGTTGAITKVYEGTQVRVLTGLPSIARRNGSYAVGPSDVSFQGRGDMYFTVGLGIAPSVRAQLPVVGQEAAGWLLRGRPSKHSWRQVADITDYEAVNDPDRSGPDSNPNSVAATSGGFVVTDAAGNTLLWVSETGAISTLAVLPSRMVDAPLSLGLPPGTQIPMQAVPTSVVQGPDGAFYVGQLTGFPFPQGAARVYRVLPGEEPTIYAEGFTNIIDIGFSSDGTLYVLEIAHHGFPSLDPSGALIRVDRDSSHHVVITDGLTFPGGLALGRNAAFISNCSVCPGTGTILRVPLA